MSAIDKFLPFLPKELRTALQLELDSADGGGSASDITFTPNGDIAATTVQAAIQEVRDDTDTKIAAIPSGGGGGTTVLTSPDTVTALGSEVLLGAFVFDGTDFSTVEVDAICRLADAGGVAPTSFQLRIYDIGTPATPAAGNLRVELTYAITANPNLQSATVSVVSSLSTTNQFLDSERMYEIRGIINGGDAGDTADVFYVRLTPA